jgi:succinylglutamate desuccinylase
MVIINRSLFKSTGSAFFILAMCVLQFFSTNAFGQAQSSSVIGKMDFRGEFNLVDGPNFLSDSGIAYPAYSFLEAHLADLAARHADSAQLIQYGKTPQGRNLNLLRIALKQTASANHMAIQISGAIHGNEFLGIEDQLGDAFLEHQNQLPGVASFLQQGGIIYLIPVVNPDGFDSRRRLNSRSIDLNRDFNNLAANQNHFTQPESTLLAQYIDQDLNAHQAKLKVSLDYHCCMPAMITPWSYIDSPPKPNDVAAFAFINAIQQHVLNYSYGNAMQTVGYLAEGSTIDYFYAKYGTLALAIEGQDGGEKPRLGAHLRFWDKIMESLVGGQMDAQRRQTFAVNPEQCVL